MKLATFNVNSIGARLPRILEWFDEARPDAAVLQEIKCVNDRFPYLEFEERGYNVAVHGQKSYNGVALLSKHPFDEARKGLPGDDADDQSRYIEALIMPKGEKPVRFVGLYAPNGNPAPGPKFDYKLAWLRRLKTHVAELLANEEALIIAGDFNVIPTAEDVHDPRAWIDDALFRPESRGLWREIVHLGLTDAVRQIHPERGQFTFWDYQAGAWDRDHGIRIDHMLLSPQAADRLIGAGTDRAERAKDKPSDHVPVWAELA